MTEEADEIKEQQKSGVLSWFHMSRAELVVVALIVLALLSVFVPLILEQRRHAFTLINGSHLFDLGQAIMMYASENENLYPAADKWCDLLLKNTDVTEDKFKNPWSKRKRCGYSMNSMCEPNSPNDVVLLFESSGGWNQFGGAELLAIDKKRKGMWILFNDFHSSFKAMEQLSELNWGDEQKQ